MCLTFRRGIVRTLQLFEINPGWGFGEQHLSPGLSSNYYEYLSSYCNLSVHHIEGTCGAAGCSRTIPKIMLMIRGI